MSRVDPSSLGMLARGASALLLLLLPACRVSLCDAHPERCVKGRPLSVDQPWLRLGGEDKDNERVLSVAEALIPDPDDVGKLRLGGSETNLQAKQQEDRLTYKVTITAAEQKQAKLQAFQPADLELYVKDRVFGSAKTKAPVAVEPGLRGEAPLVVSGDSGEGVAAVSLTVLMPPTGVALPFVLLTSGTERRLLPLSLVSRLLRAVPEQVPLSSPSFNASTVAGAYFSSVNGALVNHTLLVDACEGLTKLRLRRCEGKDCTKVQDCASAGTPPTPRALVVAPGGDFLVLGVAPAMGDERLDVYVPGSQLGQADFFSLLPTGHRLAGLALGGVSMSLNPPLFVLLDDGTLSRYVVDRTNKTLTQMAAPDFAAILKKRRPATPGNTATTVSAIAVGVTERGSSEDLAVAIGTDLYLIHDFQQGTSAAQVAGPYNLPDKAAIPVALALADLDSDGYGDLLVAARPSAAADSLAASTLYYLRNVSGFN